MLPFSILNFTLYLKENPLNYLLAICVSGDLQAVGFKKSDVIKSSIPSTPPWLLTRPAVNFTLHCSDKSNTIAYLPMALKKVRELLLLWSIETTLSVFNYLIQQASSELNYMP